MLLKTKTSAPAKKVLVVEDDPKIQLSLRVRLKAEGYGVLTAEDATLGVSNAVRERPDLIVLDIMIPGGGGLWVAKCLRTVPETKNIPVVFITASREPGLRERAELLGPAAYFEKPYDAAALMNTINDTLYSFPFDPDLGVFSSR
jgi:CheY-like chemotaxis protein